MSPEDINSRLARVEERLKFVERIAFGSTGLILIAFLGGLIKLVFTL